MRNPTPKPDHCPVCDSRRLNTMIPFTFKEAYCFNCGSTFLLKRGRWIQHYMDKAGELAVCEG